MKGRAADKAMQLLVPDPTWLERLGTPTDVARRLAERFWPGPLTLIVRASEAAPARLVSDGTIGVRVPAQESCTAILARSGPLAASSANRSGEPTPADIGSIRSLFGDGVDVYVDGGLIDGPASTVVDLTAPNGARIVREGAISADEIESVLASSI